MPLYHVEPVSQELLASLRQSRRKWGYPEVYERLLRGDSAAVHFDPVELGDSPQARQRRFDHIRSTINRWLKRRGVLCEHRFDRTEWVAAWVPQGDGSDVGSAALYPQAIQQPPKEKRTPRKRPKSDAERRMRPPDPPDISHWLKSS